MKAPNARNKSNVLKILSLLMAILLWFYVVNQGGLASGKNLVQAELNYYNIPSGLTVIGPQTVAVKLWGSFREGGDIVAYVDLAGLEKGRHTVPVKVQPVKGAMLATVQPDKVKIELEEMQEHVMPIKYELKQNPPAGYELLEITLATEKCMVIGEEAVVNQVARVVAPFSLGDNKGISTIKAELEARDAQGNIISEGIKLLPETVKAYVVVENKKEMKKLAVKPLFKGKIAEGYRLGDISTDPAEISLLGEKIRLDAVTELSSREIELTDRKESFTQLVDIIVPEGISASPLQVNVKVNIEKINDRVVQ